MGTSPPGAGTYGGSGHLFWSDLHLAPFAAPQKVKHSKKAQRVEPEALAAVRTAKQSAKVDAIWAALKQGRKGWWTDPSRETWHGRDVPSLKRFAMLSLCLCGMLHCACATVWLHRNVGRALAVEEAVALQSAAASIDGCKACESAGIQSTAPAQPGTSEIRGAASAGQSAQPLPSGAQEGGTNESPAAQTAAPPKRPFSLASVCRPVKKPDKKGDDTVRTTMSACILHEHSDAHCQRAHHVRVESMCSARTVKRRGNNASCAGTVHDLIAA